MRKLALTVALAATATLASPLVQRAEAGAIKPAPLGAAFDQTKLVQPVHCRPGYPHHSSFRTPDGCEGPKRHSRRYYRDRPYAYYPQPYPYPYAYGYRPGISFGFSIGPRRHHYW